MVKAKNKDRHLFLILYFWHRLVNIKMTPKINLSAIKSTPDLTNGMLLCVRRAEIAYDYTCIIQRLN